MQFEKKLVNNEALKRSGFNYKRNQMQMDRILKIKTK